MRQKAERGWLPFSNPPLGYCHNKDERGNPLPEEIIPDENFDLVKELWHLMLTGEYTIADIKRMADTKGLRSKRGNPYVINTFRKLFITPFYYGEFYWKDATEGLNLHQGKHQTMISKSEYAKVQQIIEDRVRSPRKTKRKLQVQRTSYLWRMPMCGDGGA